MEAALSKFAEMIPPMIKTVKELYDTLEPFAPVLAGLAGKYRYHDDNQQGK